VSTVNEVKYSFASANEKCPGVPSYTADETKFLPEAKVDGQLERTSHIFRAF
jgi:hypothetical protein